MKGYKRIGGALAGAAALLFIASPLLAKTGIDKCSKSIAKEGTKLQAKVVKALGKCNDAFRKDVAKGVANFAKAAPACEKQLGKAVGPGGASDKARTKLDSFLGKFCTDADLVALGHLDQGTFGSRWKDFVLVSSIQAAYDEEISLVRDFVNVMQQLGGINSMAVGCPTCAKLAVPPCSEHACTFVSAGPSFSTVVTAALPDIPVSLTGATILKMCSFAGITQPNEFNVVGETSKALNPAAIPGIGFACVTAIGAEGYISCGGAAPRVDFDLCQDHNTDGVANASGAAASGGCTGICQASMDDVGALGTGFSTHAGVTNGGACLTNTPAGAVSGDAFVNNTTQIAVVLSAEVGPDGLPCTADDTNASPGQPATVPLTTGTATSTVQDADNTAGVNISTVPATGSPFNCTNIFTSDLSGGKLVGAFPALHAITVGTTAFDSVTAFTLACQ